MTAIANSLTGRHICLVAAWLGLAVSGEVAGTGWMEAGAHGPADTTLPAHRFPERDGGQEGTAGPSRLHTRECG